MNKFYLSTAIDYVNSSPHLGHSMEKIMADVIARHHRLKGDNVFFLSGTDENSLKNVRAAEKEGIPINKLVDKYSTDFYKLKDVLNLSYDDFIRTTEKRHKEGVQKLWLACQKDIYKKPYRGLYCVACEEFYKESELKDGLCPIHKTKPEDIKEENYFFRLSKYQNELVNIIEKEKIKIFPLFRKNEVLNFIKGGLEDICVSRSAERARGWGIDVPEDPSQKIWVWFDALSNYINALGYGENDKKFQEWWQNNNQKLHVVGKDILRFHAVYWPAMLLSAKVNLPNMIFAHGFVTINGEKISKTTGNVISPLELTEKYDIDAIRYFLIAEFPSGEDGDFSHKRFMERYNADLANGIGNLFERVLMMIKNYGLDKIENGKIDQKIENFKKEAAAQYLEKIENYQFNEALGNVIAFSKRLDQFVDETQPWKLFKEKRTDDLNISLSTLIDGIKQIISWLKPFMPKKMEEAENYVNQIKSQSEKLGLFPRIES